MDPEDTFKQHAADTLQESYLLANPVTVRIVTEGAARGIADLERYGMPFAREADGRISQRFFGAHTYRRTAFAGDYTGLEIQRTLVNPAVQLGVPILDTVYVTRILVKDNTVFGAYGFDLVTGRRYVIHADVVILATGGHTRIWRRTSSRRDENTGDSFRLAVSGRSAGGRSGTGFGTPRGHVPGASVWHASMVNRLGLRTKPCGRRHDSGAGDDHDPAAISDP